MKIYRDNIDPELEQLKLEKEHDEMMAKAALEKEEEGRMSKSTRNAIIEYLFAFGSIAATSITSKWAATALVLATRGVFDMMMGDLTAAVELRLNLTYGLSFLISCIFFFLYVSIRRDRFTWGDVEEEWKTRRKQFFIRHTTAYFVYSLPVNIFFMIFGCDAVYNREFYTPGMAVNRESIAEPWWISNFFSPESAFFRLTRSVFWGIVLNLLLFTAVIWLSCYRKKKNGRKKEK